MIRGWRVYYAGGRTFASNETAWPWLPTFGLVGVILFRQVPYRTILDGHDWIWFENGRFYLVEAHPEWGKWAKKPEGVDSAILKRGEGMEDVAWEVMRRRMFDDRVWP